MNLSNEKVRPVPEVARFITIDHASCNYEIVPKEELVILASTVHLLVMDLIIYDSQELNYGRDMTYRWNVPS